MADLKGDTKKIAVPTRWRDTANHFLVRWKGPTTPVIFTVTADGGSTYEICVSPELARNLAAWLVTVTGTGRAEFAELVTFIKA